jgi:ATP-dependent helicase/nuclease subunit B
VQVRQPVTVRFSAPHRLVETTLEVLIDSLPGPDYSATTVYLGNAHAAGHFKRELALHFGHRVTFLPRFLPWPTLSQGPTVASVGSRLAFIHSALTQSQVAPASQSSLWPLARDILALVDEFTAARVKPAKSAKEFGSQLARLTFARAYQATHDPHFEFEAALVHQVWRALTLGDPAYAAKDPVYAAATALTDTLAKHVGPVILVDCPIDSISATAIEQAALKRSATTPTAWIRVEADIMLWTADARLAASPLAPMANIVAAQARAAAKRESSVGEGAGSLTPMARQFDLARIPSAVMVESLVCLPATTLEAEMLAARQQIHDWLDRGDQRIAIVAFDGKLARRLRATLESDGIGIADECGWPLTTAAAFTPVVRWLAALDDGIDLTFLLDLVRSPHTFADLSLTRADRHDIANTLRELAERHHWFQGLPRLQPLLARLGQTLDSRLLRLIERVSVALNHMEPSAPSARQPLADWFEAHTRVLHELGITPAWLADTVGRDLLAWHEQEHLGLRDTPFRVSRTEWKQYYLAQIEMARFYDRKTVSPVVLTSLAAAIGRTFDAVMLLGASEANVAASARLTTLISEAARHGLRLPTLATRRERTLTELLAVLSRTTHVWVSWQGAQASQPGVIAAWLSPLQAADEPAPNAPTETSALPVGTDASVPVAHSVPLSIPAPLVPPDAIPSRLPVSAWQSLLDCPYQFFARRVLDLREREDASNVFDSGQLGEAAHRLLERVHAQHLVFTDVTDHDLQRTFTATAQSIYAPLAALDYRIRSDWLTWQWRAPRYIRWQKAREAAGWRYCGGEINRQIPLTGNSHAPARFVMSGRLDRLDERGASMDTTGIAVLDYKTGSPYRLEKQARSPEEALQLPAYALLAASDKGAMPQAVAFVALGQRDEPINTLELVGEPAPHAERLRARLHQWVDTMTAGAQYPAHGDDQACRHCSAAGLCRRAWQDRSGLE